MLNNEWTEFLLWEAASRDTIDFKKIYVDMAGDLVAGLMLSQIVYWYLPSSKDGRSKLRVCKDSYYWIAKARADWWDEIRISVSQADRALTILEDRGIIVTHIYKFSGAPTKHVRVNKDKFLGLWKEALVKFGQSCSILAKGENPFSPNMQMNLSESAESITESTAEINPKNTISPISDENPQPNLSSSGFDENGAPMDTPKPRKRYVSECEYEDEHGNIEVIEDDSWKKPQKQIDHQALGVCGRESFHTKKEYDKLRKIEAMLKSGKLSEEFWRNRMAAAEKHHWSFPDLLRYTLNVDLQRKWKRQQQK